MTALLTVAITMSKVVRAIITNYRFPNPFFDLYFELHHKGDHVPFISFVVMSLPCVFTETNEFTGHRGQGGWLGFTLYDSFIRYLPPAYCRRSLITVSAHASTIGGANMLGSGFGFVHGDTLRKIACCI